MDQQYPAVMAVALGARSTGNAEVMGITCDADLRLGRFTIVMAGSGNDGRLHEGRLKGRFCNFAAKAANPTIGQLPDCPVGVFVPGNTPTPAVAAAGINKDKPTVDMILHNAFDQRFASGRGQYAC